MTVASAKWNSNGSARTSQGFSSSLSRYLGRSESPLHSLLFLLPLIIIHEIGWRQSQSHLIAFVLLHQFFVYMHAPGSLIPAGAVIAALLARHLIRRDRWKIDVSTLWLMLVESLALALPLIALSTGMARWQQQISMAGQDAPGTFAEQSVIAVGAGIYEEFLFRFAGMALLSAAIWFFFGVKEKRSAVFVVIVTSIAFAHYHYLGNEPFSWPICLFRVVAGIYFGTLFLTRGFGITAGTHAAYDLFIVLLAMNDPRFG